MHSVRSVFVVNSLTGRRLRGNQCFFKALSFQCTFVLVFAKDICYPQCSFGSLSPSLVQNADSSLAAAPVLCPSFLTTRLSLCSLLGAPQVSPRAAAVLQSLSLLAGLSLPAQAQLAPAVLSELCHAVCIPELGTHPGTGALQGQGHCRDRGTAGVQVRSTDPVLLLFPTQGCCWPLCFVLLWAQESCTGTASPSLGALPR